MFVSGIQPASEVQLTASLDVVELSANVRVVGLGETAQVMDVLPSIATVPPLSVLNMEVLLDIPAPAGGETVDIEVSPGFAGSAPTSVFVPPDQISASFEFTAGSVEGSETITATLGLGSDDATVTVAAD